MFEWKVEAMKLRNEHTYLNGVYAFERTVSRDDKIAFIDQMQDGRMSYLLELIEKFRREVTSLPKDKYGCVKLISMKAWIRRNCDKSIIDTDRNAGEIYLLQCRRRIQCPSVTVAGDVHDDLVDELFHRQLLVCRRMEDQYFLEHDEYEILKTKLLKHHLLETTTFGVHLAERSRNQVVITDENYEHGREITIEELRTLLAKYDELQRIIDKMAKETHIVY